VSASTPQPLPPEVGELGSFEARIMRNLRAAVEDWDEVCSALGAWEREHLTGDNAGSARQQHRVWVTKLLEWGRLMQRVSEHSGFSDQAVATRVRARIRHLEDKLALWHREITSTEEERILQAAFREP
jgi:hypothetical protein